MNVIKQVESTLLRLGYVQDADFTSHGLPIEFLMAAVSKYQSFMSYDYSRLCMKHHGEPKSCHGVLCPATLELILDTPRCGCPDFGIGTGSGSWPVGCHNEYPSNHSFSVNMDKSRMPRFLVDVIEAAWDLVVASYRDMGIVFFRQDGSGNANTKVTWQRGNGWIGLAIVPTNPQCGERIWAKFDNVYQPSDLLNQWARLLSHEFGHNMGMGHSRGGVMNPSIIGGEYTKTAWRGDPSEPKLTRYFGGDPVPPGPGPGPGPGPPPVGKLTFRGDIEVYDEAGTYHGTYQIVPLPPPTMSPQRNSALLSNCGVDDDPQS